MGNCQVLPPTEIATVNANDLIGQPIELRNFCAPLGSEKSMSTPFLPPGNEYQFHSEGATCGYNSTNPPNAFSCTFGCPLSGQCAIVGRGANYERVQYTGDPLTCCVTGQKQTSSTETCDPKYNSSGNLACKTVMEKHCKTNDNIFSNICNTWCNASDDLRNSCSNVILPTLCSSKTFFKRNFEGCKEFCVSNPGKCDSIVNELCKETNNNIFRDTDVCSCIFSKRKIPPCEDKKCIFGGYVTEAQKLARGDGCKVVDCNIGFSFEDVKGNPSFQGTTFTQNCGESKNVDKPLPDDQPMIEVSNVILYVIGILVLLLLVISTIVYTTTS